MKKIVFRTCVVTRRVLPRDELIRIVVTKDKSIFIDLYFNILGRGVYFKLSYKNVLFIQKKKVLEKKLKVGVSKDIYRQLLDMAANIDD